MEFQSGIGVFQNDPGGFAPDDLRDGRSEHTSGGAAREQFVKRNPLIDFYAYLEGEEAFAALVARALETGADREKMKARPNRWIHSPHQRYGSRAGNHAAAAAKS